MAIDDMIAGVNKDFPEAWMWDTDGDLIAGKVVDLSKGFTSYGPTPVVTIKVEHPPDQRDTERAVWAFHTSLLSQLQNARPQVGDNIAIKRGEKKVSDSGLEYYTYRVSTDSESEFSWDSVPVPGQTDLEDAGKDKGGMPVSDDIPF